MTDTSFWDREPSFSLLFFTGDVYGHIPQLLSSCGYAILEDQYVKAPFFDVFDGIGCAPGGLDNSIVWKATYKISSGTILIDPEMVVEGRTEELTLFCTRRKVEIYTAIWERYSQTIKGRHLSRHGVHSDFCVMNGKFPQAPVNPPADLMERSGADSIKAFLVKAGAPLDAIFGTVSAWVFKLGPSDRRL